MIQRVYLAGGFHSGWQDKVKDALLNLTSVFLFDPRDVQHLSESGQASIEHYWLQRVDIVFGYLEESNPCPLGLAVECGTAKALGKVIVLVNEQKRRSWFFEFTGAKVFGSLEDGIAHLRSILVEGVKADVEPE
jgi:hypothetical protein